MDKKNKNLKSRSVQNIKILMSVSSNAITNVLFEIALTHIHGSPPPSGITIRTRHVTTKHRTATSRVCTECNQFKEYERFIHQFTTSNGSCKRRQTIQLTTSQRTEQRCNIQPLLHNLSELQKVKTNQTSPSGLAGSNNIPEIYTTARATLRSCNYTKLSPAKHNISVPYFPIKQSHCRPGQAQRVLRKLRFPDLVTTAQDGCRLSALRTGRLYPQEILLVLISVKGP